MWKNYNRFYTQIIKSEVGSVYLCKNVNQIPCIKKVSLTCVSSKWSNIKNVLMTLSALQLIVNRKAKLITSRVSIALMKIRKGQPLGAKVFVTGGTGLQFLNFLIFNLMPRLDLTQLIFYNKENKDFKLFIRSSSIFSVLQPFFNFFQFLPSIQVVFTLKRSSDFKKLFFWRFLKLPVSYLRKDS